MKHLALAVALASLSASAAPTRTERAVDEVLKRIGAAFDQADGQAIAASFTENGTLISSTGVIAVGRPLIERIATMEAATTLKGAKNVFTRESLKVVNDSVVIVDVAHTATGATQATFHGTFLMVKGESGWRIAEASEYAPASQVSLR